MNLSDPAWVHSQLSAAPFVSIDGVTNARTLGNYPSQLGKTTKPNYIFHSAHVCAITPTGQEQLRDLGIKTIFDLRSDIEVTKLGSPPPDLGSDVQIKRVPVFKDEDYSPQSMAMRSKLYSLGTTEGILKIYSAILAGGEKAIKTIFLHIRDKPNEPFLFHCTAGKDRTGVLSALILKAAGVDDESIANEYELTAVGMEPNRTATEAKFLSLPDFEGDIQAIRNALSCSRESMVAFLHMLEERYGGIEGYLQSQLQFSAEDVAIIRSNLSASQ